MSIASSREEAIANRSVRARTTTQRTWRDRRRVRGCWPCNLLPFKGTGGRSGAMMTVDIVFLRKAGFKNALAVPKQLLREYEDVSGFGIVLRQPRETLRSSP